MLGERLFPLIQQIQLELVGKITGMLLEIDNTELLHMLESRQLLKSKVCLFNFKINYILFLFYIRLTKQLPYFKHIKLNKQQLIQLLIKIKYRHLKNKN